MAVVVMEQEVRAGSSAPALCTGWWTCTATSGSAVIRAKSNVIRAKSND
jgi:hypothetical protein